MTPSICGKQIFHSRTEAAEHIAGINNNGKRSKNRLNTTYHCPDCNGWHIASKREKRKHGYRAPNDPIDFSRPVKPLYRDVLVIKNYC